MTFCSKANLSENMVGGTNKGNTGYKTNAGIKDKNKVSDVLSLNLAKINSLSNGH